MWGNPTQNPEVVNMRLDGLFCDLEIDDISNLCNIQCVQSRANPAFLYIYTCI